MFPSSWGAANSMFPFTSGSSSSPDSGAECWGWKGCMLIGSQNDGGRTT